MGHLVYAADRERAKSMRPRTALLTPPQTSLPAAKEEEQQQKEEEEDHVPQKTADFSSAESAP